MNEQVDGLATIDVAWRFFRAATRTDSGKADGRSMQKTADSNGRRASADDSPEPSVGSMRC
jgi:hypothetical protein